MSFVRFHTLLPRCGVLVLVLWSGIEVVQADVVLEDYFQQLRRRGLFSVAETYAETRLSDPQLKRARRTELVVELSRTYAEHAAFAGPPQQDEFWQKARSILQDELDRVPPPPRAMLLTAQQALVAVVQAEVLDREVQIQPDDGPLRTAAKQAADAAIAALQPLTQPAAETRDELSPAERRNLTQALLIELGHTLRRRAELTTEAKDRAADLFDAEQAYRQSLAGTWDVRRTVQAKLGLAECVRLQRDFERAREMLTAIAVGKPPPPDDLLNALEACRVRTWLDAGQPLEAAEHLLQLRQARPQLSGELWYLQLRAVLMLRAVATQKQNAQLAAQLRSEAELVLQRVDEHAGGWWSRHCRQLWAREQSREQYGADLDQLIRRARSEYGGGEKENAAKTYGVAAVRAWEQRLPELAIESSYTRASILLELQQFEPAAQELLQLVERVPQHARAASAHLLAAYALGRLYDAEKTKSRREAYTAALQQHIERFGDGPTAGDARFMLGRLEEQRLQSTQALPQYLAIPSDHPRGLEATAAAVRCYLTILARMKEQERDWRPTAREAVETVQIRLLSLPDDPSKWSLLQAENALGLVRLMLHTSPPDYHAAGSRLDLLQRAVAGHRADNNTGWNALTAQLLPLRLVALAGVGRSEQARMLLSQLPAEPARLIAVVRGLDQLTAHDPAGASVELTELCVAAVERLEPQREQLSAADRWEFDLARVRAFLIAGRPERGVSIARDAATATAKDLERQRALAAVLQRSSSPDALQLARACWRRIEATVPEGSPAWFAARVEIIQLSLQLGERNLADKLLRITRVLYPAPEDAALRERLSVLEQQLSAP